MSVALGCALELRIEDLLLDDLVNLSSPLMWRTAPAGLDAPLGRRLQLRQQLACILACSSVSSVMASIRSSGSVGGDRRIAEWSCEMSWRACYRHQMDIAVRVRAPRRLGSRDICKADRSATHRLQSLRGLRSWRLDRPATTGGVDGGPSQARPLHREPGARFHPRADEEIPMAQAKVGDEFVTHEFDEAIAI